MNIESKYPIATLMLAELGDKKSAEKSLNQLASMLESDQSLQVYFRESYAAHLRRIAITEPLSFFHPPGKRHAKELRTKLETYFKVEEIIAEHKSNGKAIAQEAAIAEFYDREEKLGPCSSDTFYTHYYSGKSIYENQLKNRGSDIWKWPILSQPVPLEGGKEEET